jgi:glycine/D-amino acid oxidase-like deaminating enzyme
VIKEILGGRYRSDSFHEDELVISEGEVSWKDIRAGRIILCQGAKGLTGDGLFSFLNHRCAKGEILTVNIPQASEDKIINCNGWLIPLGNERWRAGATYEWEDMSGATTDAGRSEIEGKISNLTDLSFQVIEHTAGVRPILRKSQPYIGCHPRFPEVSFFNGLGSKGVTTAPSVAAHFADHLVHGSELDDSLAL